MAHDELRNWFPMITGEFLENVRAAVARGHKRYTGRGPELVSVELAGNVLTVVLEGFLTPYEQVLLQDRSNFEAVLGLRNSGLRKSIPEWDSIFVPLGLRVTGCEGNLDLERDRGVIRVKLEKI